MMLRGNRAKLAKIGAYAVGTGNLAMYYFLGESSALVLGLTVVFAPLSLAVVLKFTALVACVTLSLALGDDQERTEQLICAIAVMLPPKAREDYRETMLSWIRDFPPGQMQKVMINLIVTAPRTILEAWVGIWLPWRRRAR